jgi:hypothetical protein
LSVHNSVPNPCSVGLCKMTARTEANCPSSSWASRPWLVLRLGAQRLLPKPLHSVSVPPPASDCTLITSHSLPPLIPVVVFGSCRPFGTCFNNLLEIHTHSGVASSGSPPCSPSPFYLPSYAGLMLWFAPTTGHGAPTGSVMTLSCPAALRQAVAYNLNFSALKIRLYPLFRARVYVPAFAYHLTVKNVRFSEISFNMLDMDIWATPRSKVIRK